MEIVLVGLAVMFIFLPFALPAILLARLNKWLLASAALAAIGAAGEILLWFSAVKDL